MSTANIKPGVCGLESRVTAIKKDRRTVDVFIESACSAVKKMEGELQGINGANECFMKFKDSQVYEAANKHCKHLACPVPTGIIKAIEVECGLALPRDVEIKIAKE